MKAKDDTNRQRPLGQPKTSGAPAAEKAKEPEKKLETKPKEPTKVESKEKEQTQKEMEEEKEKDKEAQKEDNERPSPPRQQTYANRGDDSKPFGPKGTTQEAKAPTAPFGSSFGSGGFTQSSNPTLGSAAFGQSSLAQATASNPSSGFGMGSSQPARTFGSVTQENTGGSIFKSVASSGQTNTFLSSGGENANDNDMADEDIFGSGQPSQQPSAFGGSGTFGQPAGKIQSTLGFDPKSKPSFTQRRK